MLFQQVNWGRKKQNEGYSGFFLGRGGKMVEGGSLFVISPMVWLNSVA